MTIECHNDKCRKHSCNSGDPHDEGPFCFESECQFEPLAPLTREQQAKALYDACPTPKQTWAKISAVTRSVWLDRVPVGCTADELERDNPHNAWMRDE